MISGIRPHFPTHDNIVIASACNVSLAPGYQQRSQLSTVNLIESSIYPTYQKIEFLNQGPCYFARGQFH